MLTLILFSLSVSLDCSGQFVLRAYEGDDKPVCADKQILAVSGLLIDVYKNGTAIDRSKRELIDSKNGASIETIFEKVSAGDWLVFHVANRGGSPISGSMYFGLAGVLESGEIAFVSDADSADWCSCSYPSLATKFIGEKEFGRQSRVVSISKPLETGGLALSNHLEKEFSGAAIWGTASSLSLIHI